MADPRLTMPDLIAALREAGHQSLAIRAQSGAAVPVVVRCQDDLAVAALVAAGRLMASGRIVVARGGVLAELGPKGPEPIDPNRWSVMVGDAVVVATHNGVRWRASPAPGVVAVAARGAAIAAARLSAGPGSTVARDAA